MSQVSADCGAVIFVPRPIHLRLVAAYEDALQSGQNPTDAVIAKKLDVRRETIVRWRRNRPDLWGWVYQLIGEQAVRLKPLVDRRVTHLALQGSPEHTKLFYQFVAKVVPPFGEDGAPVVGVTVVNNILVPRPHMPNAGRFPGPNLLPPPQPVKPVNRDIPTVEVR